VHAVDYACKQQQEEMVRNVRRMRPSVAVSAGVNGGERGLRKRWWAFGRGSCRPASSVAQSVGAGRAGPLFSACCFCAHSSRNRPLGGAWAEQCATRIVAKIPSLRVGRSPLAPPPDSSSSSSSADSSSVSRVPSVGVSAYLDVETIV
jgi:hypothetical protein